MCRDRERENCIKQYMNSSLSGKIKKENNKKRRHSRLALVRATPHHPFAWELVEKMHSHTNCILENQSGQLKLFIVIYWETRARIQIYWNFIHSIWFSFHMTIVTVELMRHKHVFYINSILQYVVVFIILLAEWDLLKINNFYSSQSFVLEYQNAQIPCCIYLFWIYIQNENE